VPDFRIAKAPTLGAFLFVWLSVWAIAALAGAVPAQIEAKVAAASDGDSLVLSDGRAERPVSEVTSAEGGQK
jgi:hypothetical protein